MTVSELMEILATFPPNMDVLLCNRDMTVPSGVAIVERADMDESFDGKTMTAVPDQEGDFVVVYLTGC